jgi:hypothetical protein
MTDKYDLNAVGHRTFGKYEMELTPDGAIRLPTDGRYAGVHLENVAGEVAKGLKPEETVTLVFRDIPVTVSHGESAGAVAARYEAAYDALVAARQVSDTYDLNGAGYTPAQLGSPGPGERANSDTIVGGAPVQISWNLQHPHAPSLSGKTILVTQGEDSVAALTVIKNELAKRNIPVDRYPGRNSIGPAIMVDQDDVGHRGHSFDVVKAVCEDVNRQHPTAEALRTAAEAITSREGKSPEDRIGSKMRPRTSSVTVRD